MVERTRAAEVDGEVAVWLDAYTPRCVPPDLWRTTLRPFVLPAMRQLVPIGPAIAARQCRALARLAAWCVDQGIDLDVEQVLDPDTVERFVAVGLRGAGSSGTYRSDLRRMGRVLTTSAPWEPRPAALNRRHVAVPYSARELAALRRNARRQSTATRRRAARALLGLGLGAGLDGRWSTRVSGADVREVGGAVVVHVGAPAPRVVPVRAEFEEELRTLANAAGEELLVGGTSVARNRASQLATQFERSHATPRLSAARLRATWLVHHLTVGTRLPELASAAGLVGITVLSDLLAHVPAMSRAEACAVLRGA